jgi:hypothetical protein
VPHVDVFRCVRIVALLLCFLLPVPADPKLYLLACARPVQVAESATPFFAVSYCVVINSAE